VVVRLARRGLSMTGAQVVTLVSMLASLVGGIAGLMIRSRMLRERFREAARRDHVRRLPEDSRIVDLGKNGIMIEVGSRADRHASD
jgi:hypothetical protein